MAPSTTARDLSARYSAAAVLAALVCVGGTSARPQGRPDLRIMGPQEQLPEQASEVLVTSSRDEVAAVSPVLALNSYTFAGNVLRGPKSQHASHWVVVFCPHWWEPCQNIERPFAELAEEWQGRLNQDLLSSEVRFAKVDCATDKVLCNEQSVDGYPTVNHYAGGVRVAKWSGGQKNDLERLPKWVNKQFAAVSESSGAGAASAGGVQEVLSSYLVPGERAADILLALLGLAASFRLVLSNPELWAKGSGIPASRAEAATSSSAAAGAGAGAESAGGARLRRLLPEEWRAGRRSVEL